MKLLMDWGRATTLLERAAVAFSIIVIALFCIRRIDIADFWWQYRTGELVATSGIPRTDSFTYPSAGAPWIELRWIFCLLQFEIVSHLGYGAMTVVAAVLVLSSFFLAVKSAKAPYPPIQLGFILTVAGLAASQRFVIRPELATYLFLALYLYVLQTWRSAPASKLIWLLPLLQVIWTNTHTLFALGPVVVGHLLLITGVKAVRDREALPEFRIVFAVFTLTLVACLLNPYGLAGALFPIRLLVQTQGTVFKDWITELHSPIGFSGSVAVIHFYLLIAICAFVAIRWWRRIDPFLGLLLLSQGFLAFSSVRNLPLFCLVAVPFVLTTWQKSEGKPRLLPALGALGYLAVVALPLGYLKVTDALALRETSKATFGFGLAPNAYPQESTAFLKERGWTGPVFNSLAEGSYLVANRIPVFHDPRLEVHRDGIFLEGMRATQDAAVFKKLIGKYGVKVAVVGHSYPFSGSVAPAAGWKLVYFDPEASIYAAPELAATWPTVDVDGRVLELDEQVRSWPRTSQILTREEVAGFLVSIDRYDLARSWAKEAIELAPDRAKSYGYLGRAEQQTRNYAAAVDAYREAIERGATDANVYRELVLSCYGAGDLPAAWEAAVKATEVHPRDGSCWGARAVVAQAEGKLDEALSCFERAEALSPAESAFPRLRGLLLRKMGRKKEGIEALERAVTLAPDSQDNVNTLQNAYQEDGIEEKARRLQRPK